MSATQVHTVGQPYSVRFSPHPWRYEVECSCGWFAVRNTAEEAAQAGVDHGAVDGESPDAFDGGPLGDMKCVHCRLGKSAARHKQAAS